MNEDNWCDEYLEMLSKYQEEWTRVIFGAFAITQEDLNKHTHNTSVGAPVTDPWVLAKSHITDSIKYSLASCDDTIYLDASYGPITFTLPPATAANSSFIIKRDSSDTSNNPIYITTGSRCSHSWQTYEGFMDKYDFCTLCDEKRK